MTGTESTSQPRVYYFGCYGAPGHMFWAPGMRRPPRGERPETIVPWGYGVDGGLAPRKSEGRHAAEHAQGVAALHHKDGWTALSFWDRTGDSRGNSSSTFLAEREDATYDDMVTLACEAFPQVIARLTFPVVPLDIAASGRRS